MTPSLHPTRHDLPATTREVVIHSLGQSLAEAIDLFAQAKHAHWNARGPSFIASHELFDQLAEEIESAADLLAERIAQLGGSPAGTAQAAVARSRLPLFPSPLCEGSELTAALASAFASFARSTRTQIDTTAQQGDAVTADIYTEVTRLADTALWKLEAQTPHSA